MKLTIQRSIWYRGHGGHSSRLRQQNGTMCCLGFLGLACGIPAEALEDQARPRELTPEQRKKWPAGLLCEDLSEDSATAVRLMLSNDAHSLTGAKREKKLTALFETIDIQVEFVP